VSTRHVSARGCMLLRIRIVHIPHISSDQHRPAASFTHASMDVRTRHTHTQTHTHTQLTRRLTKRISLSLSDALSLLLNESRQQRDKPTNQPTIHPSRCHKNDVKRQAGRQLRVLERDNTSWRARTSLVPVDPQRLGPFSFKRKLKRCGQHDTRRQRHEWIPSRITGAGNRVTTATSR